MTAQEDRQERRPQRAPGAARRAGAERLRHRSHLAARDVPVRRHVHRPARRDELLHRRRRAGQGPRQRIAKDQETLAAIHQTVEDTRARTNELRQETAAQKRELDRRLASSRRPRPQLKKLEKRVAKALGEQKARYAALARNKANAAAIIRKAAADQKRLAQDDRGAHREAGLARQHPVQLQRHDALADGRLHGQRRVRLQLVRAATRRATAAPTTTTGSTWSAPYGRDPRGGRRAWSW